MVPPLWPDFIVSVLLWPRRGQHARCWCSNELGNRIRIVRACGQVPPIDCYAGELNQVFMGLLVNAIQAISGEGTIEARTSVRGDRATVQITDSGGHSR